MAGYSTKLGKCIQGDSLEILHTLSNNSIDLIITCKGIKAMAK